MFLPTLVLESEITITVQIIVEVIFN